MDFTKIFKDDYVYQYYKSRYEDISEPLGEYQVHDDGSLTLIREPRLLGVKKNGKWGWIDSSERFVIPAIYDQGFVLCYDGVILLVKDGKYGGLYSINMTSAFQFRYERLGYLKAGTYIATDSSGMQALVRPGDNMLTDYKYIGFMSDYANRITYVRRGFFGETSGIIDPETGRELS